MTSIIKFHALSGVQDESPPCYILQVDEFRFLLDCGWDENFDLDLVAEVRKQVHQIDAVLISYPDLYHLGALPYLVGKCGLNCPIYATIPVYKMGQMFMYDIYQSRHNTEEFDLFNLDDVDTAFDKMIQLKYSQTITLHGKGQGLQITPLPGGHMIGGTIWRILKDGDEDLIYAVDYNHKKERHLNGCVMDTILRPTLLITDAFNSMYAQARRRTRDEQLVTNILQTMRAGGNCLIAVDTAGRVLELAHLLDQLWRNADTGLMTYSIAFLNNVSYNVVEFAKSQMEWMSEKIMRGFEDRRNNPFQFRYVQLCHSLGELAQVPEPKVVLATSPDLECGFSRDLFIQWCKNTKNTIILTSRTGPTTLARKLIDGDERRIPIDIRRRVKLDAHELEDYMRAKREKEALEAALKARENAGDAVSSDESDMETEEPQKHDLMPPVSAKPKSGFFKLAKKSYPMFPHHEERLRWDEYGEVIRHSDFIAVADLVGGTTRRERHRGRGARGPGDRRGGLYYKPEEEQQEEEPDHHEPEPEPEPEPETMKDNQAPQEMPTKCVSSHQIVDVNAKIVFIDFEGRSDGESIKKLLAQMKPKQMIIVHGSQDATEFLADYCRVTPGLVSGAVHTPERNDVIDATTEGCIYQVKLRDSLMTALKFFKAKDLEVAWVDARIAMTLTKADTSAKPEQGRTTSEEDEKDRELIPTLCAINPSNAPDHNNVFINEPKLSDLKTVLVKAGLQAEFIAGVLVVNSIVAVKRNEAGKLQIEGCLSEDYYRVRSIIYDQYAIV